MSNVTRRAAALSVRGLTVSFASEAGRVDAVRGITFDVAPGTTTALVGESGSGKSATATAIMGLLPDTATVGGSVSLGGRELIGLDDATMSTIRGADIGMIFQDPLSALTPVFTVGDQIVEALRVHQSMTKAQAWSRATELLDLVGIPDPSVRVQSFPHELSGGMRQRVMIAMAIANSPSVIIADEPTTALDVTIQAQILTVLRTAAAETGAAVLLITHDLGVVAGIADQVVVMYGGRAVEQAPVDELYAAPRMPYTLGLLAAVPRVDRPSDDLVPIPGRPPLLIDPPHACLFAPRCPIVVDECRSAEPELVSVDGSAEHHAACYRAGEITTDGTLDGTPVFAPAAHIAPTAALDDALPVLRISGLRKEFPIRRGLLRRQVGTVRAVNGIDLEVRRGETVAIVGESGSGKSTTLLEVMEFGQPAGVVELDGTDPASKKGRDLRALRRRVSIVFQDPGQALDPRFTAFDILAEPLRALGLSRPDTQRRVDDLMMRVGLDPNQSDRYPAAFSGGQRQRLAIARALATEPALIVLDEPLSALDVSVQADIVALIRDLQRTTDVAYLVVAHDLAVVGHLADRVAVMYLGRFVETGPTTDVFDNPTHPYTQALLSAVPIPDPAIERTRTPILLTGEQPSATTDIVGCAFASRCPLRPTLPDDEQQRCRTESPQLSAVHAATRRSTLTQHPGTPHPGTPHTAACHFARVRTEEIR